jgi:hypothetical protein
LIELGQTAITAAQMSEVKREEVRRKAREEAHLRALQWEKIYLELDKRRLRVDQELRRRLSETRGEVVKVISFELAKTSDPKSWWERKLPVRLRQEFLVLAQGSEAFLIESLARDTKWLQNEVNRVFSTRMNQGPRITTEPLEPISDVRNIVLTDIERQRLYTRIGSGAAMIAGYLLIGPIGSAIGIATVALGEYFFNKQVEEQRRHLKEELGRSIDRAVEEYSSLLSQRLQTLYHQIAQDMKRKQTVWEAAKDAAIKASGDVSDERIWQQLIAEAATLRHDILTSLEK